MPARLIPLLLLLLTRDGLLHRFDGTRDTTSPAPRASALALVDGRLAILAGARLSIDGKVIRGDFHDLRALAGGAHQLWALAGEQALAIDRQTGKRTLVLARPRLHRLAADGDQLFAETDGTIEPVLADPQKQSSLIECNAKQSSLPGPRPRLTAQGGAGLIACKWRVAGHPIALAAGDGKLWAATKEGPLWQIDRATGAQTQLGLGDWWGTLALAYSDGQLYAVTLSGKIWRIDPNKREKTIVAMDGWQGAIDLAVLR